MKRSSHSFDLALSFLQDFDICAKEFFRLENSSNEIRKICKTDSKMDVSKNISRKLSEASLQRFQEGALLQNDYLIDFLHSDNFWVDIIAMGVSVSSSQESAFVPISSPKSIYDSKFDNANDCRSSPMKLFPLDLSCSSSTSNSIAVTNTMTSVPSFRSLSSTASLSDDSNQNNSLKCDDLDRDSSVYETAVALSDVTISDLADSDHNDNYI